MPEKARALTVCQRKRSDVPDVGMVQRGEDFGFPLEPGESIRIIREGVGQDLQRHVTVELGISGLIDLAHAAFADLGGDFIRAESGAGFEWHSYGNGTRSLSSSNQLRTTVICGDAALSDSSRPRWMLTRRPSGATSKELFSKVNNSFYFFRNWIPVTGTYDDIINSGRLLYIENQQLRNELSGFRRTLDSIREYEGLQTKTFYENQAPFLTKNQDVNYSTWSGDYRPPISPFSVDISPFATVEYWNLVIQWIFVHADVISNYRRGVAHCDRILELIDIELASKRE